MNYRIRKIKSGEYKILDDFLYEAVFISESIEPPPKSIIEQPELQIYVKDFGKRDDYCLVAEKNGKIIGAVWVRIMYDYGHIADNIPSLAISVYKEFRGQGVGTDLLDSILSLLKSENYEKVSLSVQKENYAYRMYLKAGFEVVDENDEEYIMVCDLKKRGNGEKMSAENKTTGKKVKELMVSCIEAFAMIVLGQMLGMFIMGFISGILNISISDIDKSDIWETAVDYGLFIGIWLVTILILKVSKKKRPILQAVGTKPDGNNILKFLFGIMTGFVLNGVCIFIAWLHGDIAIHFESFRPLSFVLIFAMVLIQSSAEELVCRGFLYQILIKNFKNPAFAIVGNSLLFASVHIGNNGITILSFIDICLVGILFSLMVYYMDSLWCAFAVHTSWNFTQAIIFGLPNSGNPAVYSVFKIDSDNSRNSFAYNTVFGIEGTVLSVIILALACVALYLWGKKYGKNLMMYGGKTMSWSLELIRTKTNTEHYDEEKYEDVIPFTKSEILDCINDIHEIMNIGIEDAESNFVHVYGEKWRVEICFWKECLYSEKDMTYCVIELQVRGNTEPKEFLSLLSEKLNARLFDMSADRFWTCDSSGFSEWKSLCDRIV